VSVAAASFDCGGFALDPDVSFRAVTALMRGYINSRTCGRQFIRRDMSHIARRAVLGYGGALCPRQEIIKKSSRNHRLPNRRSRAL
jgi:hypothetical protein